METRWLCPVWRFLILNVQWITHWKDKLGSLSSWRTSVKRWSQLHLEGGTAWHVHVKPPGCEVLGVNRSPSVEGQSDRSLHAFGTRVQCQFGNITPSWRPSWKTTSGHCSLAKRPTGLSLKTFFPGAVFVYLHICSAVRYLNTRLVTAGSRSDHDKTLWGLIQNVRWQ